MGTVEGVKQTFWVAKVFKWAWSKSVKVFFQLLNPQAYLGFKRMLGGTILNASGVPQEIFDENGNKVIDAASSGGRKFWRFLYIPVVFADVLFYGVKGIYALIVISFLWMLAFLALIPLFIYWAMRLVM